MLQKSALCLTLATASLLSFVGPTQAQLSQTTVKVTVFNLDNKALGTATADPTVLTAEDGDGNPLTLNFNTTGGAQSLTLMPGADNGVFNFNISAPAQTASRLVTLFFSRAFVDSTGTNTAKSPVLSFTALPAALAVGNSVSGASLPLGTTIMSIDKMAKTITLTMPIENAGTPTLTYYGSGFSNRNIPNLLQGNARAQNFYVTIGK